MGKIKQSLSMSMRILKMMYLAENEIDVDYIERKISLTRKQIYDALRFLHKENLIEKNMITFNQFPAPKKLMIKISKKGIWAIKKYKI